MYLSFVLVWSASGFAEWFNSGEAALAEKSFNGEKFHTAARF